VSKMQIKEIVGEKKLNRENRKNDYTNLEFNNKFKNLINKGGKMYYFDEIINKKSYDLDNILKNDDENQELKLFVEYLKGISKLKNYFRRGISSLFRYEEDKEIDYFRNNIINIDNNYDIFLNNVKGYAYILINNGMTTSQIRNVYSDVLRTDRIDDLKRLRPKFAYIAGRSSRLTVKKFMDLLDYAVKSMNEENGKEQLKNFKNFLEAIVAYMKYFGDKN
jgi:CRISPR-associated protein Csm2